jgi:hypothetical protein
VPFKNLKFPAKICVKNQQIHQLIIYFTNYITQKDFGTRNVYCVSNVTVDAESKYVIKIFPAPTVFVK